MSPCFSVEIISAPLCESEHRKMHARCLPSNSKAIPRLFFQKWLLLLMSYPTHLLILQLIFSVSYLTSTSFQYILFFSQRQLALFQARTHLWLFLLTHLGIGLLWDHPSWPLACIKSVLLQSKDCLWGAGRRPPFWANFKCFLRKSFAGVGKSLLEMSITYHPFTFLWTPVFVWEKEPGTMGHIPYLPGNGVKLIINQLVRKKIPLRHFLYLLCWKQIAFMALNPSLVQSDYA